ncbi:MAG: ABC transporter ATP-binding protein [Bacteriovoracaceae bacterium]|nr:ABC transporter ATP-binding protein [Bacteriovoracaceae bacterium]
MSYLSVHSLSESFESRKISGIYNIAFDCQQGTIVGILGPSGCGKSTLLRTIEKKIASKDKTVSCQAERVQLFEKIQINDSSKTVWDTLVNAVHITKDSEQKMNLVRDVLSAFELTTYIKDKVSTLSQGQYQRVLLCKTLVNQPELLLLDEPFAHLDKLLRNTIMQEFFAFLKQKQITCLWVGHEPYEVLEFSDQVLLLNAGRKVQFSSPEDLYLKPNSLFSAQFFGPINIFIGQYDLVQKKFSHALFQLENFKYEYTLNENKACLAIRPESWKINHKSKDGINLEVEIVKSTFQGPQYLYQAQISSEAPLSLTSSLKLGHSAQISCDLRDIISLPPV